MQNTCDGCGKKLKTEKNRKFLYTVFHGQRGPWLQNVWESLSHCMTLKILFFTHITSNEIFVSLQKSIKKIFLKSSQFNRQPGVNYNSQIEDDSCIGIVEFSHNRIICHTFDIISKWPACIDHILHSSFPQSPESIPVVPIGSYSSWNDKQVV